MQPPTHAQRIRAIFDQAIDLPPDQRQAFLDRECANDPALRDAVNQLLTAHESAGSFLADPTILTDRAAAEVDLFPPGTHIGVYTITKPLGEGGFSTVYLAEQDPPLKRRVALKFIKPGMDTKQIIARFELERRTLAMMDHPNIAAVYDAGATEAGRPYFVMELVDGRPITDFCREFDLSIDTRLNLFASVCSAVQHAHERGVIHRDLKPGNVLVTLKDGNPVPKVIDFGIAKALTPQNESDIRAAVTMFPQFLGTPQYMSPDQAELSQEHVDSRSDVYSLGALLYELLTDVPPYDPDELSAAGYAQMQRILREVEPIAPSARVLARSKKLAARLRGELDWIIQRAMAKEPARRYQSAEALSADVARYIADEPVAAGPPGMAYRARKFIRRNRHILTMTSIAAAALLVGAIAARWNPSASATTSPQTPPPPPAVSLASVQSLTPGLKCQLYSGHFDQPFFPATPRIDRTIDFTWTHSPPEKGMSWPKYAIRWTGVIVIPEGGCKSIGIDADDGGRVSLDGHLYAETTVPGRHMSHESVLAGAHAIQIEYWNRVAGGRVMLIWNLSGGRQINVVPANALFH